MLSERRYQSRIGRSTSALTAGVNRLEAAEWLEKAAEQGSPDAQYGLAYEFSYQGRPRYDLEKAKYWALKAAHNGQKQARRLLQEIKEREEHGDSK